MRVSLVAVCHHSSGVLPECVLTFRRQAMAAGLEPEVIVVEHSEDDHEASAVAVSEPDKMLRRPNRGYAAGLNAGMSEASGELILLANPDIVFLDGSVGALAGAIADGVDVAGPQLFWDRTGELFLPIPDNPSPAAELVRTLGRRWPSRRSVERVIEQSWRLWTADVPADVPSLRGPLLALSRDGARRLGPLDEDYFLYYEETEWLWRARRAGARLALVPGSRVVHQWGHSTSRRGDSASVEERSRARFFDRNYPRMYRVLLELAAPRVTTPGLDFTEVGALSEIPPVEADIWLVSIVDRMQPAMGCLRAPSLPREILEIKGIDRWYAIAAKWGDRHWRLQGRWTWETR